MPEVVSNNLEQQSASKAQGLRPAYPRAFTTLYFAFGFISALALLAVAWTSVEVAARQDGGSDLFEELKVFTDVLAVVQRDYVSEIDSRKAVEGAIKGLLTTLDPHSGYLDPTFYQDLQVQTKGEFGGLGIEITVKDGLLVVVAPMDDSPAAKAGVKAGDAIVKIGGEFTKQLSLVEAVQTLRGPKGSPVTISVHREGMQGLLDLTIVRDIIKVKSVRHRYLEEGFGYVRVTQFVERTADDLEKALAELKSKAPGKELKGLVLDLRNNPGGLLNQAIRVSDLWLKDGIIVYTDGRVEQQKQKFYATERGTEPNYPIIVLVNGGSASASEIVAGSLKDHGRALILGSRTFGKGSVQTISPLSNGGALTLTTALYYTKSGRSLQAFGVEPDIEFEGVREDGTKVAVEEKKGNPLIIREQDLPGAIKNPDGRKTKGKEPKIEAQEVVKEHGDQTESLADWLAADQQVARALELLKTFNVFGVFKGKPVS